MIVRIVKITFDPEKVTEFLSFFDTFKLQIRNAAGCTYLQVLQDQNHPNIIFSYSHWNHVSDLDNYRNSDLFKMIWPRTKALFIEKPEAWSTTLVHDLQ